jgi:hypothetical protein
MAKRSPEIFFFIFFLKKFKMPERKEKHKNKSFFNWVGLLFSWHGWRTHKHMCKDLTEAPVS